jgi:transcriptional regulator with XRE-family HTH domain
MKTMTATRKTREWPAARLVELRERFERTQQECADALGIGQPSYARMESGLTPLRRRDMVTLSVLYGLDVAEAFPADDPESTLKTA